MSEDRKHSGRWAGWWLIGMLTVAAFADFLANDRPLVASVGGEVRFPVLHEYGRALGLHEGYSPAVRNWYRVDTDWVLWPPVPYAAGRPDVRNANYRSPFAEQETGNRARHYLGTDKLGRDVLAGLIRGTRVAVFVGCGAVLLSFLIGVPLGGVAGFFGNRQLRVPRYRLWGAVVGGTAGLLYGSYCILPYVAAGVGGAAVLLTLVTAVGALLLTGLLYFIRPLRRCSAVPADALVLQGIELFVNVPGLVLLIALVAIINRPSLSVVVLVIGVLRWPVVARYLRAELLRIRSLPYIDAARVSGIPPWRVLFRHALPNALGPLFVVASFSLGGAILLEAFLSFLGIGIPADQVTWGSLLRQSRQQPAAWWLAVFPGLMLTLTVMATNRRLH